MLYIEDEEEVKLPKKFHSINNLCAIIYDQLTEILVDENYISLTKTIIPFNQESQLLINDFDKGEIHPLDWLKENKLNDELATVLAKHITMSILSDFVNFIYESLSSARKGKMSVAYALLRKPLTDELLIFEQILNDKNEFIDRFFHNGLPSSYDPSERGLNKEQIIEKAFNKLKPKFTLNKEIIFQLRYDKSCKAGINGISNQALHIVTKDSNYRTANQDLNFVFSNPEDLETYFKHYYNFVPYLLIYSVAIIDELIFSLLPDDEKQRNIKAIKSFRRLIGQILLSNQSQIINDNKEQHDNVFETLSKDFKYVCDDCGFNGELNEADFKLFFGTENFICSNCFMPLLNSSESIAPIINLLNELK